MAVDRLLPISTTPGAVTGNAYMDAVQEEVTGLWNQSCITLTGASGTDTITATAAPVLTAGLANGMNFILKAAGTNTTTSVTLNINGGGAVSVRDATDVALAIGALRSGGHYLLAYDSTTAHFHIVSYVPAATLSPGMRLLQTQVAAGVGSLDFVNGVGGTVLDDTYDTYQLILSNLKPATDTVEAWIRIGTGGTPTYQTTTYHYMIDGRNNSGLFGTNTLTGVAFLLTGGAGASGVGNAAAESLSSVIQFNNPESASEYCSFLAATSYVDPSGNYIRAATGGGRAVAGAVTGIRVMFSSGNITSGRATLYGWTKA